MSAPFPVSHDSPASPDDLKRRFERLKEKVLSKRPILDSIIRKQGWKKILDYANEYVDVNLNPTIPLRQNEMLDVVRELTTERYGSAVADSVVRQLEHYYFVSTADHTGPINHPFFVNSNLLTAASLETHSDANLENIIIFSCANVSMNNSSIPRGLFFHTADKGTLQTHRLSFFPSNMRGSVYLLDPYTRQDIAKIYDLLKTKEVKKEITAAQYECLRTLFKDIYEMPGIFDCKTYIEQVSKTNPLLWNALFKTSGKALPRLVYLEQETIAVRLLIKYHLTQDTIINHMLFDPAYESYITNYFEGIFGSFSRKDEAGTYLFWGHPEGTLTPVQLWKNGRFLESKDGSFRVELTPEAVKKAMESKELIPSLLLNFSVISFYYGMKCLGGFNQVNYLTLMKNSYIKMNVDLGNYRSVEVCARAQTKEICDGLTFAFLGYRNGANNLALASGLDLILYGQTDSWKIIADICRKITLEQALNALMPEMYHISYDEKEWEPELATITDKDASTISGLSTLIHPGVTVPERSEPR